MRNFIDPQSAYSKCSDQIAQKCKMIRVADYLVKINVHTQKTKSCDRYFT